jgi:hypothetical protein
MKFKSLIILLFNLILFCNLQAQYNGNRFSISASYNYTTTSKLFLNPDAAEPVIKGLHENLDDIFSHAIDIRYRLSEPIILGVNVELIEKKKVIPNFNLGGTRVEIKEGFLIIPIELSIYYILPFSTEDYKFFMGGGSGFYIGDRKREFGDVNFERISTKIGFGINVAVGMEYIPHKNFSIRGQMLFRDPEVEFENRYSKAVAVYNNRTINVTNSTYKSKVNIDGVTFSLGISLNF